MYARKCICRFNSERLFAGTNHVRKRTEWGGARWRGATRGWNLIWDWYSCASKNFPECVNKFTEYSRICRYNLECWWLLAVNKHLTPRCVCLPVKHKLKFILICLVEVKQQIWINVQKTAKIWTEIKKYDLRTKILLASTYELSTNNHIYSLQNTWWTYKKYWVLSHN